MPLIGWFEGDHQKPRSWSDLAMRPATRAEAVELAARRKPGLILADVNLGPGGSGQDAVADILASTKVPVIFVTAYPERLLTGTGPEPAFVITKPFDPMTLASAVRSFVPQPRPDLATLRANFEERRRRDTQALESLREGLKDGSDMRAALAEIGMPQEIAMRHRLPHFQHVFSGSGYASAYYSYMWSEVLDADALIHLAERSLMEPLDATAMESVAVNLSVANNGPADGLSSAEYANAWLELNMPGMDPLEMFDVIGGQPATILLIAASGSRLIRATVSSPAIRRSAGSIRAVSSG